MAGETSVVDEAIYRGFLTVFAPYRVKILEDGVSIGSSEDGKLMLGSGTHRLEFVNTTFNVRETRTVDISPGGTTALSLEAPRGEIEVVNVADGTEVWVDNEPKGTTPMGRIGLPVGTHNVLLRPGQGRSFTVEVVAGKVIQVPKGSR